MGGKRFSMAAVDVSDRPPAMSAGGLVAFANAVRCGLFAGFAAAYGIAYAGH